MRWRDKLERDRILKINTQILGEETGVQTETCNVCWNDPILNDSDQSSHVLCPVTGTILSLLPVLAPLILQLSCDVASITNPSLLMRGGSEKAMT